MDEGRALREAAAAWLDAFGAHRTGAAGLGVPFAPTTFKEVLDGALALGRAAGRLPEAMRVLAEGERCLRRLRERLGLARRDRGSEALPRVACVEALAPLRLAGGWVPDLVAHAGGRAVLAEPGQPALTVPWEALAGADPDHLVVALRGCTEAEAHEALQALSEHPTWPRLRAVREGRVLVLDGDRLIHRPGPGLFTAVERLASALHPA